MVFEHVVFTCAVFVCAILGRFPQRLRNIRNGLYRLGRACRRLGDVSRTMPVILGMRLMVVPVLVIMGVLMIIVMMMRRVLVVIGVIVMFVIVRVVMMAFLSVSMGGLVQSLCRRFQA